MLFVRVVDASSTVELATVPAAVPANYVNYLVDYDYVVRPFDIAHTSPWARPVISCWAP